MDRSRSNKRGYYYDHHQDYESENYSRNKPRYSAPSHHNYYPNNNRQYNRGGGGGGGGGGRPAGKVVDSSMTVTTNYRILCHDAKAGGVIGKSGSIIKAIRQHTGAWINVHELASGDEERIIEIYDTRRRDPDGRIPSFSPAQEALLLIHERILESEAIGGGYNQYHGGGGGGYNDEEMDYGGARGGMNRVVTRLVVSRMHVGSLLGKGGKIIEQMRMETKTQIRVLPRDHSLPRCVSVGEEIVQVVGDENAVKKAITIISSRLRESQHRDRSNFQGRSHSDDRYFDEEFAAHNNPSRRSLSDGDSFNSRLQSGSPNNRTNYDSRYSSPGYDADIARGADRSKPFEDLVFRILCPNDRVDSVVGESNGILDILQDEIGVDIKISDPLAGSEERVIVITSDEGPDDELFPAQEALLHIQTQIADLVPDKENIATTRLLVPVSDIGFLNEGYGSLSELRKMTGANIEILPREKLPPFISAEDEILQIVGEIKAAREALLEVTARLRNYIYKEFFPRDVPPVADMAPSTAGNLSVDVATNNPKVASESYKYASSAPASEIVNSGTKEQSPKEAVMSNTDKTRSNEVDRKATTPTSSNRIQVPLVTRSTLEVVIPEYAVSKLLAHQKKKLGQISELSGSNVTLVEDNPDTTEKVIRISGTPEQAERAQSLLQGFLLSIQEDGL